MLVSRAAGEHPSVRRAQVAYDVAQLETEKARAQALPTVDAVASAQGGHGTIAANATGYNAAGTLGVQINVPLYTGGAVQNRVRETIVLEERSRNDLEAARRARLHRVVRLPRRLRHRAAQVKALEAAEARAG